jgi:alpha-glucosidase
MLQEDDGLTFAALAGARFRTDFEVARSGHTVVLRATVTGDGYPEFARERFVLVLHGADPSAVRVDGAEVSGADGRFEFDNSGTGFTIEFSA